MQQAIKYIYSCSSATLFLEIKLKFSTVNEIQKTEIPKYHL